MSIKQVVIMTSTREAIYKRIVKRGRGSVFTNSDFYKYGSKEAVDKALSRLSGENIVLRITKGIYNYPVFSKLLNLPISPKTEEIVKAVARKNNSSMLIDKHRAANLIGLTEQTPAKQVFITDGPDAEIYLGKRCIKFSHTNQRIKELSKFTKASIIIQALNAVGRSRINESVLSRIKEVILKERINIAKCINYAPKWMQHELHKLENESIKQ